MLIYCIDENYKNTLIDKGLHFLREDIIDDKVVYVFVLGSSINFNNLDKTKVFQTNVMTFD